MAEKSRWSLGAKLKGLFGKSKATDDVAAEPEIEPEIVEIEVPIADVSPDVPPIETLEKSPKKKKLKKSSETSQVQGAEVTAEVSTEVVSEPVQESLQPEQRVTEESPVPVEKTSDPPKEKAVAPKPQTPLTITEQTWEDLEDTLLSADFGPDITDELIEHMRSNVARYGTKDPEDFVRMLREAIEERLNKFDTTLKLSERPAVILVVGVNGVGKTTTIGKLGKYIANAGKSVVVGAADTFRAAAVDQLATWAQRAGVDVVRPQMEGQDPSAVAYQTIESAIQKGTEIVIIDTAGRLQTKSGLMDELSKIRRVIEKQAPISEVLLVLDATTGQNGLSQAEAFLEHAGVTGLVLTKLDGSAKGGFVLAVQENTGIPVKLVGNGEGINDLIGFTPHAFAAQLVS